LSLCEKREMDKGPIYVGSFLAQTAIVRTVGT